MTIPSRRGPASRGGSLRAPAAGFAVLAAAAAAFAGTWGVPLGKGKVQSEIAPNGDVDTYLLEAHAGALLDVKVTTKKGSALALDVELRGPDGTPLPAPFEAAGSGLRLRRFAAPESGRYELRVAGAEGSAGAYSVSATVKGSANVSVTGLRLSAGEERSLAFAAGGGARVAFTVRSKPLAAAFARIVAPDGGAVPVPSGAVRANAAGKLKGSGIGLPASGRFGAWRLVVRADASALDDVRAKIVVKGGRLPTFRGRLPAEVAALTAVTPQEAGAGTSLRITGRGLSAGKKRPVRVFVGGAEASDVVLESATAVLAKVPSGVTGTVDVGILNGDGHAPALRNALLVVPPPRVTTFAPTIGPAGGGTVIEVRGSGFRAGTAVTLAGTAFGERTEIVSDVLLRFTTPAFASGDQTIGVRDPTGQESLAAAPFRFVAAPFVLEVRPPLVPQLAGETVALRGGAFTAQQTVTVGGIAPDATALVGTTELRLDLPVLPLGRHDVVVRDPLDQVSTTSDGVTCFTLARGADRDGSGGAPPSDLALCDYDDDGDLDVFLVSSGGATLSTESHLRVLRNDRDGGYVDVTDAVIPAPSGDDWRGDTIAFGDVAADVGSVPPDGHPDLVIGSLDESVLGSTRSRVRILANRSGPGGTRVFVDRTAVLMSAPSQYDDWRAADLWIGDLDDDGGVPDIVATHDEIPTGVSPLSPYYVYYLSGTRVFSFATPQSGGYGAFAWQSRRMPHVIGTQVPTQGFPQCIGGNCRDTYTPFRGTALAVTDLDGDGRRDIAVSSPGAVIVAGTEVSSTQLAVNRDVQGLDVMLDRTSSLSHAIAPLRGDLLLVGNVIGDAREDLVVVRHPDTGSGLAVDVVENRGFDTTWFVRTKDLLPVADQDERLQADAAELVDVDGDGDLDLVLLAVAPPTAAGTASGFGLRLLRNHGEEGFSRELEDLLPASDDEDWNGTVLAGGEVLPGRLGFVLARPDAQGDGTVVRTLLRTTEE